jgi:hypothetical protein
MRYERCDEGNSDIDQLSLFQSISHGVLTMSSKSMGVGVPSEWSAERRLDEEGLTEVPLADCASTISPIFRGGSRTRWRAFGGFKSADKPCTSFETVKHEMTRTERNQIKKRCSLKTSGSNLFLRPGNGLRRPPTWFDRASPA